MKDLLIGYAIVLGVFVVLMLLVLAVFIAVERRRK